MADLGLPANFEPVPGFLLELPSRPGVFFSNLRDLLFPRSHPPLDLRSAPAPFWHDVFVHRPLPWNRFFQSGACHIIVVVALIYVSRFMAIAPHPAPRPAAFDRSQVIYYEPADYLPQLDTRDSQPAPSQKPDPAFAPQPIISVPPESDNRAQTIVTPPNVKLKKDVPLPNIVAWTDHSELPIAPAPVVKASAITRLSPQLQNDVVAPPPDASRNPRRDLPNMQTAILAPPPDVRAAPATSFQAPQPAVIEPPPSTDASLQRSLGELNIANSAVIAPAPQLTASAQRAIPGGTSSEATLQSQVVPPPPSVAGSRSSNAGGRIIALNLHPSVAAPADPPPGNRRGTFAATPDGHPGASGNPGSSAAGTGVSAAANKSEKANSAIPPGLFVGPAVSPKTAPVAGDPAPSTTLSASAAPAANPASPRPPTASARPLPAANPAELLAPEQEVFSNRRFYAMTLNMPNLNSGGGTWVIHFSELKQNSSTGDLSAPLVLRKVDPGYPLQIMRENVSGTVILYAVIRADGTVGNIRILRSVDDRLDRFAARAVAQWQFQPATKDGSPVDVEATFKIPFRPPKLGF